MADKKETSDKKNNNKEDADATAAQTVAKGQRSMAVRLGPVNNSDQPVLANYSSVDVAPGMAFIDFGFIEPGTLARLPRLAGDKLPKAISGRLAVRVGMGYDVLANLYQQLGHVLTGLNAAARERQSGRKQEQAKDQKSERG